MNEEKGVKSTIESINKDFFEQNNWDLEIIVIDGDSKDDTRKVAKGMGAKVVVEKRRGYGRAYKTGMKKADGDVIVTGDADATYPFDEIHRYIEHLLDSDLDFVTTDRFADIREGSMTLKHRFGNLVLAWGLRILYLVDLRDSQSGMWIFKKRVLDKVKPLNEFSDGMPFSEEIKIEMFTNPKISAEEIPSTLHPREGSVKLESFKDGWLNFKYLFRNRVK